VTGSRRALWLLWAVFLALLALELAIPRLVPARPDPWHAGQTAVAGFVLSILALVAGVGTFALRESLVLRQLRLGSLDPRTRAGSVRVGTMLLALWTLCLLIGLLGGVIAYGAASPRAAWPYVAAAAVLLVLHAPRDWLFTTRAGLGPIT
jgi:hypothetical protein